VAPSSSAQLVAVSDRPSLEASPAAPLVLAPVELPRARRPGWPLLASLAIATGVVALALGAWAIVSAASDEAKRGADRPELDRALGLLGAPDAERLPLRGSLGRIVLVARPDGAALLVLNGLGTAPDGREYEAWVVPAGSATPIRAGTFDGSDRLVLLTRPAPPGTRVAVTLETDGGVDRPTRPHRHVAERAG
jgi:hypothetical protein